MFLKYCGMEYCPQIKFLEVIVMTKKILAVVMALALMLTACTVAFAEETPTDVVPVLKLDANSGEGTMEDIAVNDAGVVVVPENVFTKNNFDFTGWNTNADGSGTAYEIGAEIALREDLTLFAQWIYKGVTLVEYTVTYDANGGEGETVDEYGPYIEGMYAYTAYNNFTKGTATFVEWNTAADGSGQSYGEDEMFEIYEDVVLYAIWEGGEEEVPSEPEVQEPIVEEPEEVVTETDENPETGSASAAGAVVAGVVALGALVVLKKRD